MIVRFTRPRPDQDARFYTVLFHALRRHHSVGWTDRAGPVEPARPAADRPHEGLWAWFDDVPVFFDMSDHVFLFDAAALDGAEVYFKANLHRGVARRALEQMGRSQALDKLEPFLFLPPRLSRIRRWAAWTEAWAPRTVPRTDICHIVGVYENRIRDGESSPLQAPDTMPPLSPAAEHFWVRWETSRALAEAGLSGPRRLVSRGRRELEDGRHVHPNLAPPRFFFEIWRARFAVVNTLPHALLPWKALEALALGRPLALDVAPRVEMPAPFRLEPDRHFIELWPGLGDFDAEAPLDDPRSYRLLRPLRREALAAGVAKLKEVLRDRSRLEAMEAAVKDYGRTALAPRAIADYIADRVGRRRG
jgi:hypothetical protein